MSLEYGTAGLPAVCLSENDLLPLRARLKALMNGFFSQKPNAPSLTQPFLPLHKHHIGETPVVCH